MDITARYLMALANKTAIHAYANHRDLSPTISDVRMALQDVGAFWPQTTAIEEECFGEEDMRGVEDFLTWMVGDEHKEIRRIAGLGETEAAFAGIDIPAEKEDYLTALKKKHSKTGEEARFQGTALGIPAEDRPIRIEGGPVDSIRGWNAIAQRQIYGIEKSSDRKSTSPISSQSSPLSDV
ncbi:MAG: hypothetical protein LQ342_004725 [Letrouitia transgressa]|nr:MAG: hypothetical protein LQ342_004725 [Letrouitia transgressa]